MAGYKKALPSPAEQGRSPEGGAPGAPAVLQKAPQKAPHPKGGDQQRESIARLSLTEAVFLHYWLLKSPPGGRNPGENLNHRPGR